MYVNNKWPTENTQKLYELPKVAYHDGQIFRNKYSFLWENENFEIF